MGFKNGVVATIWKIKKGNAADKFRDVQISVSRKNKHTNSFQTEFSGYVRFVGNTINGVDELKRKDRIVLKGVDVTRRYDPEEKKEYINFTVYDWVMYIPHSKKRK